MSNDKAETELIEERIFTVRGMRVVATGLVTRLRPLQWKKGWDALELSNNR